MSDYMNRKSFVVSDDHGSCTARIQDDYIYHKKYDAFGQIILDEDESFEFGYGGFLNDKQTNGYYVNARVYDPVNGRFIAKDRCLGAIAIPQSLNRYSYCCNRPVDYEDDDGEWLTIAIGAAVGGLISAAVSATTQTIDGIKEGKSIGESLKSIDYKEVGIEFAKGAVKGAIAGTGIGVVQLAAAGAVVDMAGDVAKQTICDGKSLEDVDKSKVLETGIFSFGFSVTIGGLSKALQGTITNKLGIKTGISDLKGREEAMSTVKEQIKNARTKNRVQKLTARLADKTKEFWKNTGKYTLNKLFGGAYGMIESTVYKKKLKAWVTGNMDYVVHCTLNV